MSDYPEHDKQSAVETEYHAVAEFLEWLSGQGIELCRYRPAGTNGQPRYADNRTDLPAWDRQENPDFYAWTEGFSPISDTAESLLGQHFNLDPKRLEVERRAILAAYRQKAGAS